MRFKEIKNDSDLERYRYAIEKHIDVLLPLEYLKQGRVFGYFGKDNSICGGFALITQGPFRVLDSIPNFEGLSVDPALSKTAELTGVWLSKEERNKFSSLHFWLTIIFRVVTSRKKYFVYAYSTKKISLEKIYAHGNPIVLFRGETTMLPGMIAPDHESVEVLVRSRIYMQALKNPNFFLGRIFIKSKNKQKKIQLVLQPEAQHELSEIHNLFTLPNSNNDFASGG